MAIESTSFEEPRVGLEPTPQSNDRLEHNGHATEARNERRQPMPVPGASVDGIAQALGWFSVGLGVAELLAPRKVSQLAGIDSHPALVRACGLRELASGVGILAGSPAQRSAALWARVAGDMADLAILAPGLRSDRDDRNRTMTAVALVAGVGVLDVWCAQRTAQQYRESRGARPGERAIPFTKAVTIARSPQECYDFWRKPENRPRFMNHVETVQNLGEGREHWVVRGPLGAPIEWDSETTVDEPGRRIAWRALPDSDVVHEGSVTFEPAPGDRGTIVRVEMHYEPPGGMVGDVAARIIARSPEQLAQENLRRFKQLLETGEIPTTEGQPHGRRSLLARATPEGRK